MGGAGAATVVVAQPDHGRRELLARIIEAAGQNAVRLEATEPPVVVDTTVESSALVLVLDATAIGFGDLDAIVDAFATRRYPAKVIALVDGPASAASASAAGASVALERPFQRDDFVAAMADLLGIDVPPPAEPTPADTVAPSGDVAVEQHDADTAVADIDADETPRGERAPDADLGRDDEDEDRPAAEPDADADVDEAAGADADAEVAEVDADADADADADEVQDVDADQDVDEVDVPGVGDADPDLADVADGVEPELQGHGTGDDRHEADVESVDAETQSEEAIDLTTEAADLVGHVDPVDVDDSTENEPDGAAEFDHEVEPVLILGEAAEPDEWDLIEAEGRVSFGSGDDADAPDEPATGTDAAERATTDAPDNDERAEDDRDLDESNTSEDDDGTEDETDGDDDDDDGDKARPLGLDHSFTDILRMGRQL